jgi:hypothetical protein
MYLRLRKECPVCRKIFSSSNLSRHIKAYHTFCGICNELTRVKKHPRFRKEKKTISTKYTPVWVPILLQQQLLDFIVDAGGIFSTSKGTPKQLPPFPFKQENDLPVQEEKDEATKLREWHEVQKSTNCLYHCPDFGSSHDCINKLPTELLLDYLKNAARELNIEGKEKAFTSFFQSLLANDPNEKS